MVGGRCFIWSVVCGRFFIWSVVGGEFLVWSVLAVVGGRLVMWSVVGVLHFYWSVVCFYFWNMVGGRCLNQYMVGGRWLMVGGLWSVAGRWAVVFYYAQEEYVRFCIFGVIFSGIGETDSKTHVLCSDCVHQVYTTVTHLISSKYRVRSETRSSRKSRIIFFRGFFTPSFPFCAIPKTENSEM